MNVWRSLRVVLLSGVLLLLVPGSVVARMQSPGLSVERSGDGIDTLMGHPNRELNLHRIESDPSAQGGVVTVLRPYEAKLKASGIPVFLPSWLPETVSAQANVSVWKGGYEVALYLPDSSEDVQSEVFDMYATRTSGTARVGFPLTTATRPIRLHNGGGFS